MVVELIADKLQDDLVIPALSFAVCYKFTPPPKGKTIVALRFQCRITCSHHGRFVSCY